MSFNRTDPNIVNVPAARYIGSSVDIIRVPTIECTEVRAIPGETMTLAGNISTTGRLSSSFAPVDDNDLVRKIDIGGILPPGGALHVTNTTESTSAITGALIVDGGVGIAKAVNTDGAVHINDVTASASTVTGALTIAGGAGIAGAAYVGGVTRITNATASTSTATGAITVAGGAGIAGAAYVGGVVRVTNATASTSTTTGALTIAGGVGIAGAAYVGGITRITDATASTSAITGALVVTGGVGIGSSINIGGASTVQGISYFNDYALFNGGLDNQRKIVFNGDSSNYYQYRGIGMNTNEMRYQVESVVMNHSFRAGINSTTDQELMRIAGNLTEAVGVHIHHNTSSINTSTGALVVSGGIGIAKEAYIGGLTRVINDTDSTTATTGALTVAGGVGITKNLNVDGYINSAVIRTISYSAYTWAVPGFVPTFNATIFDIIRLGQSIHFRQYNIITHVCEADTSHLEFRNAVGRLQLDSSMRTLFTAYCPCIGAINSVNEMFIVKIIETTGYIELWRMNGSNFGFPATVTIYPQLWSY